LIGDIKNATPKSVDVSSEKDLDEAVSAHDLIISLIPYTFHVAVMKSAIKFKRNVVTTSYISDAIKALEPEHDNPQETLLMKIGSGKLEL
jgi:saccharopine dehydrogenase-like NADP-dependent oxidoreductase